MSEDLLLTPKSVKKVLAEGNALQHFHNGVEAISKHDLETEAVWLDNFISFLILERASFCKFDKIQDRGRKNVTFHNII